MPEVESVGVATWFLLPLAGVLVPLSVVVVPWVVRKGATRSVLLRVLAALPLAVAIQFGIGVITGPLIVRAQNPVTHLVIAFLTMAASMWMALLVVEAVARRRRQPGLPEAPRL
ncbi:MAG: hypothetical protein M3245_03695 [Actinomycetota bacterium]|nr:hypothetical protein [Actinomycetota bacterium]